MNKTLGIIVSIAAVAFLAAAVTLAVLYSKEKKKNADIKAAIDKGAKLVGNPPPPPTEQK